MGWAKFDDQFTDHPKVAAAGPLAELLAMRAVIHCARHETDGHVKDAVLPRLAVGIPSVKRHVAALVREGMWEEDSEGDGWWVHDFLDYHPSRAEKEQERKEARERMARVRANKTRTQPEGSDEQPPNEQRSSDYPDPTPPLVPSEPPPSGESRKRSDHATRLPDDWRPTSEPELVAAIGGQQAARREWAKFCDYWRAKAGKDGRKLDWQATWRNWLRRAAEGRAGTPPSGITDGVNRPKVVA